MQIRAEVLRRVARLKPRYSGQQGSAVPGGGAGGPSLLELFHGFMRDGGQLMRAALNNQKPLTRQGALCCVLVRNV